MPNVYKCEIVTPTGLLLSNDAVEVNAPGGGGYLGILAGHVPLLTPLGAGEVRVRLPENQPVARFVIGGGFLQVGPAKTTLLVDLAKNVDDIDLNEVQAKLDEHHKKLTELEVGSVEHEDVLRNVAFYEACAQAKKI